jgi:small subunit ribosomal protein S13
MIEKPKRPDLISKEAINSRIIRIMQSDIPGNKNIYTGLTKIKGISWAISNAVCLKCGIPKRKKVEALTKEDIERIESEIKKQDLPEHLKNRRNDFETGKSFHLIGSSLDLNREMDIKRLKKIRSFKGLRHATGQPVRGQRTRSHFRVNRKRGVGVKTKKTQ